MKWQNRSLLHLFAIIPRMNRLCVVYWYGIYYTLGYSRIDNHTRVIPDLLKVMTTHTCNNLVYI